MSPAAASLAAFPRAEPFGCILADPPWRFETYGPGGMGRCPDGRSALWMPERHYPTMALDEIKALPVRDLAARDCVLLMWTTDSMLPASIEVGAAWGFTYKTVAFYWVKERRTSSRRGADAPDPDAARFPMGTGYWTRANPEPCLLFTRGAAARRPSATNIRKLLIAPRREHSRKPDEQYPLIEQLVDGPYLELFARTERPYWRAWGNQTDRFAA